MSRRFLSAGRGPGARDVAISPAGAGVDSSFRPPMNSRLRSCAAASICVVAIGIILATFCQAQVEQGAIVGLITDPSGAAVPGAKVTVTNTETQVASVGATNDQGNYVFPFLPHGRYSVTVEKSGFSAGKVTDIELRVGLTATINVTLKPGAVQQEI